MKTNKISELYEKKQNEWKTKIKAKPTKWIRFWSWVWYLIAFPFVWLFYNIRDWRSAICVIISLVLWSGSVWIWYLMAIITWGTDFSKWAIGIGSAVFAWWMAPVGSPFLLIVTFTAIGMKMVWDKIKHGQRTN